MTFQPRNRRLCVPAREAFTIDGTVWYVDDAEEVRGEVVPFSWGREACPVRVTTCQRGFTLVDDRGRFLKVEQARRGEYRRRVRKFRTAEQAAWYAVRHNVETCA